MHNVAGTHCICRPIWISYIDVNNIWMTMWILNVNIFIYKYCVISVGRHGAHQQRRVCFVYVCAFPMFNLYFDLTRQTLLSNVPEGEADALKCVEF